MLGPLGYQYNFRIVTVVCQPSLNKVIIIIIIIIMNACITKGMNEWVINCKF